MVDVDIDSPDHDLTEGETDDDLREADMTGEEDDLPLTKTVSRSRVQWCLLDGLDGAE